MSTTWVEGKASTIAEEQRLWPRRVLVLALNLISWLGLGLLMARIIGGAGWSWAGVAIMLLYLIALPWTLLAFWNAVIGFFILRFHHSPASYTNPALNATPADALIISRTAICVCIRHESVTGVVARVKAMRESLDAMSQSADIEFHVLSDSARPDICAEEAIAFGNDPRLHYRRRTENIGYKAGNLRDFATAHQERIDFMIALDADSLMSGAAILRLIRVMQANPNLGILQTLVTGRPATSAFARIFQFGMRHGMRTHTTGIAWWQGSSGPYWGHNAIIRLHPFVAHCALPVLRDGLPLAGHMLSHDQVEAALMRAAGFDVRVIADEFGSWEENPPRLPDFIRRDLRWCQGNLQYLRLIGKPGFRLMGRFQLCNAVAMYLGAPASVIMLTVGIANGFSGLHGHTPGTLAFGLYFGMLILGFAPRLLGVIDILMRREDRERWGGGFRLLAGAATDAVFTLMIGPVMMVAQSRFIFGLLFGHRIIWEAQQRDDGIVPIREAIGGLWPQFLLGLGFGLATWHVAPASLLWALPTLAGSLLAVPFACFTASPRVGAWMRQVRLCAVPGE
ncbi:glucans biosynthesis glucosyltransferase MdoH [Acidisoma cellulosilytica]|uniref:Glucans biosynthesis glucosyltransferase H n=1 Tax=Acidisoma cellulosilyticum TaxID=2802395 RepID=A0A964E6J2_9PROT|nr:glucans biosynthesis glucosyltransferase MdoH [Acidisoma cellulosilyticum]MCB8883636.1 glucans biosynthesis glucosyltransferase MdoH [Acidisoma cellulosilyticum]